MKIKKMRTLGPLMMVSLIVVWNSSGQTPQPGPVQVKPTKPVQVMPVPAPARPVQPVQPAPTAPALNPPLTFDDGRSTLGNHPAWTTNHPAWTTNHPAWTTNHPAWVTNHPVQITNSNFVLPN